VGLAVLDTDLRYLRVNDLLAVKNGIPADQHIDRTVREIIPSIAGKIETVCRELIATGNPRLNVEMIGETVAQPDVKRTWLNSYFPLKNLTGKWIGINVVFQDLTKQSGWKRDARR
jgi:PAS fold